MARCPGPVVARIRSGRLVAFSHDRQLGLVEQERGRVRIRPYGSIDQQPLLSRHSLRDYTPDPVQGQYSGRDPPPAVRGLDGHDVQGVRHVDQCGGHGERSVHGHPVAGQLRHRVQLGRPPPGCAERHRGGIHPAGLCHVPLSLFRVFPGRLHHGGYLSTPGQ